MMGLAHREIFDCNLVSLDFETTGLQPEQGDRVIELAVVRKDLDGSLRKWSSLVNPGIPIPAKSSRIHGITDALVQNAPSFSDLLPKLLHWLRDSVLIAHNISFDIRCLSTELSRLQIEMPSLGPQLDTLAMARHWFGWPHCNLKAVSERLNIPVVSSHRALYDAECTMTCFHQMLAIQKFVERPTADGILSSLALYRPNGQKRQEMREVLSMAAETGRLVTIDYVSGNPKRPICSQRSIQVKNVHLNTIQAFCHLREDDRFFSLKRIQQVRPTSELL